MKNILEQKCKNAKAASFYLASSTGEVRNKAVENMASALVESADKIIAANKLDIEYARGKGIREAMIDRLMLNEERINAISRSLLKVAALPDPLGGGDVWTRPNGLDIKRVRVPLGNIAIIYEARPNVTADAAALCIKSGNTVILRGGSEAINSNIAIVSALREAVEKAGISAEAIQIIEDTAHETANILMGMTEYVNLLIPRGSKRLIKAVKDNASVPVIETGAGNCSLYIEKTADFDMALDVLYNAKMQRPSVCNAIENLLVDEAVASEFLPLAAERLAKAELRGCEKTCAILKDIKSATEEDFFTEYDDYILAIKVVSDYKEAVELINVYNTSHSESIITNDVKAADYFVTNIDAAAVYVNASTRFTDGEEFGFGAEIGISTQKLHARGPMGLNELTTIKYIVKGNGQIRK